MANDALRSLQAQIAVVLDCAPDELAGESLFDSLRAADGSGGAWVAWQCIEARFDESTMFPSV